MRRQRRGFTLVEVLVATGVLAIGSIATLRLVGLLIHSNANMSANTDAVANLNVTGGLGSDADSLTDDFVANAAG